MKYSEEADIRCMLDDLIIKYKIDRFHPRFVKKRKAIQYLTEYFSKYEGQTLILIVSCETDGVYIQEDFSLKESQVLYYDQMTQEDMEEIKNGHKKAVVVSYYKRREIISFFHNHSIEADSIYDYLATKKLILEGNYYDIFGEKYCRFTNGSDTFDYREIDMNAMFFYDRRCYEVSQEEAMAEFYLARMIFDCVYTKNFPMAEKYIQEYTKRSFPNVSQYQQFLLELNVLLEQIKELLQKREKEDVIIFWLDQLEYGEDEDMPFLKSLGSKGLDFEHAYTVTPYTHSTARVLLTGEYTVDDRLYKKKINKDCELIKQIEGRGYSFKFYTFLKEVKNSIKGDGVYSSYTPFSEMCWNALCDMVKEPLPVCMIIHELPHTHSPYISFGLTQSEYFFHQLPGMALSSRNNQIRNTQKKESLKYTDEILNYYFEFIPSKTFKIFMSDHGSSVFDKWHTIFRVVQKDLGAKKIRKIFSYIHFQELLYRLLDKQDISSALSDYALVQDVDFYNRDGLKNTLFRQDVYIYGLLGYKGVITLKDRYIRYNDGKIECMNHYGGQERITEERERYLSSLVTAYPEDLIMEDKFKYSRNVYRTIDNYYKRNEKFENRKKEAVRGLFHNFSDKNVVAIRGGGLHTLKMWFALEWRQKNKIDYIIDCDSQCIASRMGVPVITPEDMRNEKIDTIVISSWEHEEDWYQELIQETKETNIIRLYKYLEDQGVSCSRAFYWEEIHFCDVVWEE